MVIMFLWGVCYSCNSSLLAQSGADSSYWEIREEAERRYLPSDELLNGEKYNYPYRSDHGTPFFEIPGDPLATVQIGEKIYTGQRIRYDIFNQVMVLEINDIFGARGGLVLQQERIGEVEIGAYRFRWFRDLEGKGRYGQIIGDGPYLVVFFWEKQYLPDLDNGQENYFFTDPARSAFLRHDGRMCPFKSNRSLLRCFPDPLREGVKAHLRKHHIRIRKASFGEVRQMLVYVNQSGDDE